MRLIVATASVLVLTACQPNSEKTNPAIATDAAKTERAATAPAAGANSFTMEQARDRIVSAGYAEVTALTQDSNGLWRGTATKNGTSTPVMVDYQGNVAAQ